MRSERSGGKISVRNGREDGAATKALILETAGRLFAEHGYADVTCRDICESAGTNMAAVNYHFGSREALYITVLQQAHDSIFNLAHLRSIMHGDRRPEGKLALFIDYLTDAIYCSEGWRLRVWGREMAMPSGLPNHCLHENGMEKFRLLAAIIAEMTGLAADHADMKFCVFNVMAPFMVLMTTSRKEPTPHRTVFESDRKTVAANMKKFIFAGLDAYLVARGRSDIEERMPMEVSF